MAQTKVKLISNGVIVQGNLHASHGITTAHIGESTDNLYYTDARVSSYLSTNSFATESYVGTQIANLVDSSPSALNTLNELAAALGDDANFSTTVTNSIALKAPLASPSFTGNANFAGTVSATKLVSLNGILELDDNGTHNGIINAPASLRINIDSDNSNTGEKFVVGHNQTSIDNNNELFVVEESGNATFAGIVNASRYVATGQNLSHGASRLKISQENTTVSELRFYGPNTSTAGALRFVGSSSDGSVGTTRLTINADGSSTFAGNIYSGINGMIEFRSSGHNNRQIGIDSQGFYVFNPVAVSGGRYDLKMNDSGNAIFAGNVNVGGSVSSPGSVGTVLGVVGRNGVGAGTAGIVLKDYDNAAWDIWNSGGILNFRYNNGAGGARNGFSIDTTSNASFAGRVYIEHQGTNWNETTPGQGIGSIHLDPVGDGANNTGNAITFGASDHASGSAANAGIYTRSDGSYGTKMYFATTDSYAAGSKTAMMIDYNGNVGIGETSPNYKLNIASATNTDGIYLSGLGAAMSTGEYRQVQFGYSDTDTSYGSTIRFVVPNAATHGGKLEFYTDAGPGSSSSLGALALGMVIDDKQRVGIGTTSPETNTLLHLKKNAAANTTVELLRLDCGENSHATSKGGKIVFRDINVYDDTGTIEAVRSGGSSSSEMNFRLRNETIPTLILNHNGSTVGIGEVTSSYKLRVKVGSTSADNGIYVTAGTSSSNHALYVEGESSGGEWLAVRGDGEIRLNATNGHTYAAQGIRLGANAASNNLDDYEEGTWTPSITASGGNAATAVYSTAYYTKVGRLVNANVYIHTININAITSGNYILLTGLPFTSLAYSDFASTYHVGGWSGGAIVGGYVQAGQSYAYLMRANGVESQQTSTDVTMTRIMINITYQTT